MDFLSGIYQWLTGEEEKPAQALVLGAELKCPWGTSHSYLYVESDNIDINNLPQAHVEDCVAFYNINPFGKCIYRMGQPCEQSFWLADRWENSEPQNVIVNGREIITTKSTLICQTSGTEIKAVTTGQDAIYAKEVKFYKEMMENYPGLLETLLDPYGSLYLDGEMYETAFQFLDDCLARHGGEIPLEFIYGTEPEGRMIKTVLERLNPDFKDDLIDNNTYLISQLDMSITSFESEKEAGRARAEEIRTNPVERWFEENQKFISELEDNLTQALCAVLLCSAVVTTAPIEGPSFGLIPQTGTGVAGMPATIGSNICNEYQIIGVLPGAVPPQLPSLGEWNTGESGTSTLNDWVNRIPELSKQAPIEIPSSATVKVQAKNGYDQINFKWTENGKNYEVRWHTKTHGAPEGQGNTWVVSRVTPGTPTGQVRTEHILVGDTWIPRYQWQDAINAYRNGTATQEQLQLLKDGHWQAP